MLGRKSFKSPTAANGHGPALDDCPTGGFCVPRSGGLIGSSSLISAASRLRFIPSVVPNGWRPSDKLITARSPGRSAT